jgi:hypothetical protein
VQIAGLLALSLVAGTASIAKPPAAWIDTSTGRRQLAQSSYCWGGQGKGICADYLPPRCDDGGTPRIAVLRGEVVRFRLGFVPRTLSLVFLTGPGASPSYARPHRRTTVWRVRRFGAFFLFAGAGQLGDTSYAGCFVARR